MRLFTGWIILILQSTSVAIAQPVSEPNGRIAGTFGDVEFDAPALCERAPFVTVRTHGASGMPAFEAAIMPNSITSVEVRTEDYSGQFGALVDDLEFPVLIAGDIDGIEYSIEATCPDEFSD